MNKIQGEVVQTAITSLVSILGTGDIFKRICAEIERTNTAMPEASGLTKKEKVLSDLKIIFDDVIVADKIIFHDIIIPVSGSVINLLIELGVAYVTSTSTKG